MVFYYFLKKKKDNRCLGFELTFKEDSVSLISLFKPFYMLQQDTVKNSTNYSLIDWLLVISTDLGLFSSLHCSITVHGSRLPSCQYQMICTTLKPLFSFVYVLKSATLLMVFDPEVLSQLGSLSIVSFGQSQ